MKRQLFVISTIFIAIPTFGQTSEEITWHETTGTYTIFYIVDGDTLDYSEYRPGNQIDPFVGVDLARDTLLAYSYTVQNGSQGRAQQGIRTVVLHVSAEIDTLGSPSGSWVADFSRNYSGFGRGPFVIWYNRVGGTEMIGVGDSLSGFLVRSEGLPTIQSIKLQSLSNPTTMYEGPKFSEWDSLIQANLYVGLPTIGPRDPPSPFDLGEFIDTVATYPSRASDLGWIDSAAVADQLQTSLDELSDDLAEGDSVHAAGLIKRTLEFVESRKDSTLSSEAYALFRFNLEYALAYLPD